MLAEAPCQAKNQTNCFRYLVHWKSTRVKLRSGSKFNCEIHYIVEHVKSSEGHRKL